jgi:hypothetical protein
MSEVILALVLGFLAGFLAGTTNKPPIRPAW